MVKRKQRADSPMDITGFIDTELEKLRKDSLLRELRPVRPLSAREVSVGGTACLNFSSNDYLGLSWRPELREEASRWMELYGAGAGASRLVTGDIEAYGELERRIAAWKGAESALLFGSGFLANVGCLQALASGGAVIFADRLNHASLNAGCKLSGAEFKRFRHGDLGHLDELLEKSDSRKRRIIVSDTVFSMDGDVADLDALRGLSKRHGALLYLDDAHATGVFGDRGEGLATGESGTVVMGTFSKAMGSYGAYVACESKARDYLVNTCWSFIFTTALPPQVCGAISAAVGLVSSDEFKDIRSCYIERTRGLRAELRASGFDTGASATQIVPVMVGESETALRIARDLLAEGIIAVAIRPPTVPAGTSRMRINLTAAHTDQDVRRLVESLRKVAK